GMGAVAVVVAGNLRTGATAGVGRVHAIVPVVVVVGGGAVPAAIVRLQRVVLPADAGVLPRDDHALAGNALGPDRGCVDFVDAPFGRRDFFGSRRNVVRLR